MDITGQVNNTSLEIIDVPNGNNDIYSGGGWDIINGGIGYNVLHVNGNEANYVFTKNANGYIDIDCTSGATQLTTEIKGVDAIQFNDKLLALPTTQVMQKSSPSQTFIGYARLSSVVYAQSQSHYTLSQSGNLYLVVDTSGGGGQDILRGIERVQFTDASVALDLNALQAGGSVAQILGATFGLGALSNPNYVGIGLHFMDSGSSYASLVQLALNAKLGSNFTPAQEIDLLYTNILGISASAQDVSNWSQTLASGQYTAVSLAVMAAQSQLNTTHVNLTGLALHGLAYVPYSA